MTFLSLMTNNKMRYFEQEDILYFTISDEPEANSIEIGCILYL
ncbi:MULTISPECIES: DUF2283 domain-containing protein [unclassified Microcystis]